MATPSHAAFGHLGKQALNQIQPASARGREMDMIAGMARQPSADFADLVGAVVVHHQMNLQPAREIGIVIVEKSQEFLMAVSSIAIADSDAACHIGGPRES